MIDKNTLLDYMARFRLECHYRLDMVPGDIRELPIFMYQGAHESVRETMIKELELSEEYIKAIDEVSEFFISKLQELDHYTKADDITVEEINNGKFNK